MIVKKINIVVYLFEGFRITVVSNLKIMHIPESVPISISVVNFFLTVASFFYLNGRISANLAEFENLKKDVDDKLKKALDAVNSHLVSTNSNTNQVLSNLRKDIDTDLDVFQEALKSIASRSNFNFGLVKELATHLDLPEKEKTLVFKILKSIEDGSKKKKKKKHVKYESSDEEESEDESDQEEEVKKKKKDKKKKEEEPDEDDDEAKLARLRKRRSGN